MALLLGEASDYERAELEEAMADDPALKALHRRLRTVHELLEASESPEASKDATESVWKLQDDRRAAVLKAFKSPATEREDKSAADEEIVAAPRPLPWLRLLSAAAVLAVCVGLPLRFALQGVREDAALGSIESDDLALRSTVVGEASYDRFLGSGRSEEAKKGVTTNSKTAQTEAPVSPTDASSLGWAVTPGRVVAYENSETTAESGWTNYSPLGDDRLRCSRKHDGRGSRASLLGRGARLRCGRGAPLEKERPGRRNHPQESGGVEFTGVRHRWRHDLRGLARRFPCPRPPRCGAGRGATGGRGGEVGRCQEEERPDGGGGTRACRPEAQARAHQQVRRGIQVSPRKEARHQDGRGDRGTTGRRSGSTRSRPGRGAGAAGLPREPLVLPGTAGWRRWWRFRRRRGTG